MKTEYKIIAIMILLSFSILFLILQNLYESPKTKSFERYSDEILQINEESKKYQLIEDVAKFNESKKSMQEKLGIVASNLLEIDVTIYSIYESYFPFIDGSQIKILDDKSFSVCNIVENIPIHLQEIQKTEKFQTFVEKYSNYSLELDLHDERKIDSSFHYGLIAKSDDGRTALTMFHVNNCTNQVVDSEKYYLSCHDDVKHMVFGTTNKDDILASLNHPDFCTIPLDSWRQSVYDYNRKIKEQLEEEHLPTIEIIDKSYKSVSAYQLESQRLDLLGDISIMYVMKISDEKDIEGKIKQYNNLFGPLPEEFLKILDAKK